MKPNRTPTTLLWMAVVITSLFVGNAHAGSKYQVIHNFLGKPATGPDSLVADSSGNLYGTTSFTSNRKCAKTEVSCGVVFKLTPGSDGNWTYTIIHVFKGLDGSEPSGKLIFDSAGNLYGAAGGGGVNGTGAIFELSPSGDKWQEKVLYSFGTYPAHLVGPVGALTFDANGNLYGAAVNGAPDLDGGIFELKKSGGTWQEITLHEFAGPDGADPTGDLVWDSAGNLYGSALNGGQYRSGVVFELMPGNGNWTENVLYSFTGGSDGANPEGVVFDSAGNLYGTTAFGGDLSSCNGGCGTVFSLNASSNWALTTLHAFNSTDGASPDSGVIFDSSGSLYATTLIGGTGGRGVAFKLSNSGSGWVETVLHNFDSAGENPVDMIFNQGLLYGVAGRGGRLGDGVVFSLAP